MIGEKFYEGKIELLISWSLSFYIILLGLNSIVNKFVGNTPLDSYFLSMIYAIIAACAAIPIVGKALDIRCLTLFIIIAGVIHIGANIYDYPTGKLYGIIIFFIVGYALDGFDGLEKYMTYFSYMAVLGAVGHVIGTLLNFGYIHDMTAAYEFLPMSIYTMYLALYKKKFAYKILALVSGIVIFVFGTRGPMLLYVIGITVIILRYFLEEKTKRKILLFIIFAIAVLVLIANYELVLISANNIFEKYGMNNSILNRFLNDSLADDNGRNMLKEIANRKISENLFLGYGCFADRKFLNTYCHSLYRELWMDFGIFFGTLILVFYLWRAFRLLMMNRKNDFTFAFLIAVYSVAIGKLFLSGSYLEQGEFFLVLGFLLKKKNFKRQEASMINEENIDSELKLGEC